MTDHFVHPSASATSRVAALHALCRQDFAKGESERANASTPTDDTAALTAQYNELDTAIRVAQQLLDSGSVLSLREGLRLLLRALHAEPTSPRPADEPPAVHTTPAVAVEPTDTDEAAAVRRSVDAQFPIVAAFLRQDGGNR